MIRGRKCTGNVTDAFRTVGFHPEKNVDSMDRVESEDGADIFGFDIKQSPVPANDDEMSACTQPAWSEGSSSEAVKSSLSARKT
jgi:hypothetical protein